MKNHPKSNNPHRNWERVEIHPSSIKHIKKGHPWVIEDRFTKNFPAKKDFLLAEDRNKKEICLMINDPGHKTIKARVWTFKEPLKDQAQNFFVDLKDRIRSAVKRRIDLNINQERNNYYLIFGESDHLPGLFVERLGDNFRFQCYCHFWMKKQNQLFKAFSEIITELLPEYSEFTVWFQERSENKSPRVSQFSLDKKNDFKKKGKQKNKFLINEFGIRYQIKLGEFYDCGIYTDMSAMRDKLQPLFCSNTKVLNLFSYTGAFSLFALKKGASDVYSVDISKKYQDWLNENLKLNPELTKTSKHHNIVQPVEQTLKKFIKDEERFDIIVSDPPSFSSDGKTTNKSLHFYKQNIAMMAKLLAPEGRIICFLNTHNVHFNKFQKEIQETISHLNEKLVMEKSLVLDQDCPKLQGFPEGSYLKGIVLRLK